MSFRDDLAGVLARDPRYSIHAYAFVFEALEFTKAQKRKAALRPRDRKRPKMSRHVTGRELAEGARLLALGHYGLMAMTVLAQWGIHSTSDFGEIVYNLIATGDLERSPHDDRADFDDVYAFEEAFRRDFVFPLDEVA